LNIFCNFIKTGILGEITLGVSISSVQEYLGSPEDVSISRKPIILKYGSLQMAFYREKGRDEAILDSINICFDEEVRLPKKLAIQERFPKLKMCRGEFLEKLDGIGIKLEEDKQHTFNGTQIGYKSEAGVIIIFNSKEKVETLASVFLTARS
jgi:hypothetical protein